MMIDKGKFTYFSLGKAFEKQIKAIENLAEKQIKAIEEHGKHLAESNTVIKKYDYDNEKIGHHFLLTEVFKKLIDER